ncbi:MAG: 6-phosphofructokinase [Candidatus Magasanikbacteria bacterium]|nr:6-phosphofructokinase [Candidatus Magasanikbacteria bacterium]
MAKTLLVLTGGGLSPACNSLLFGVINEAQKNNWKILGGLFGWRSLLEEGQNIDLSDFDATLIRNKGGTFLRSSRINPFKIANGVEQIKQNFKKQGVDALVVIGGDDTLGAAHLLSKNEDIQIIGLPKTIDNDLSETYWTPGYPSAAWYFADFVKKIKMHAAYALSRIFIVEVPGFKSGWLAASGAYGLANVILTPEKPINCRWALETIAETYLKNGGYAVVVVSQYAKFDEPIIGLADEQDDQYNNDRRFFIGLSFTDFLKKELKLDVRSLHPGNFLEAVDPIEIDKKLSEEMGAKAVQLIVEGRNSLAVSLKRPDYAKNDIEVSFCTLEKMAGCGQFHFLSEKMFDFENFTVTDKFFDYLEPVFGPRPKLNEPYLELQKRIVSEGL